MTNPFAPKASVQMPTTDRVGGFVIPESNMYLATIKTMYMMPTQAGGLAVKIVASMADGEHTFTTYPVTVVKDSNKKPILTDGKVTQTNTYKDREGKDVYLADFLLVNSIVQLVAGTTLDKLAPIPLIVKEWSDGSQQDTQVQGWSEVQGKQLVFAVKRVIKRKVKKVNDKFVTTDETRQVLRLDRVMCPDTKRTYNEVTANVATPEFHDAWITAHAGKDEVEKAPAGSSAAAATPSAPTPALVFN